MTKKSKNERADLYTRITDKIVADLEQGVRPWMKPWANATAFDGISRPLRYNGEPYSGLNVLLLGSAASARGYASPKWMTFKQSVELGGAVRKGETGTTVIYASRFTKREADGHGVEVERAIPFLKSYTVFNVAQIEGLPDRYLGADKPMAEPVERIAHADQFFRNTGALIHHGGNQAFYSPGRDFIQMPAFESFKDPQAYVGTLSHESVHWTAHPDRVGRDLSRYSSDKSERAREELIAELGSCFLCADLGIVPELEPRPDHASYVASWLTLLEGDRRAIFQAAAHAQRAVAYLHDLQPQAMTGREAA